MTMKKLAGKALLSGGVALAALGLASGTAQAFNPQPDPPGKPIGVQLDVPGRQIAVNPQSGLPGVHVTTGLHIGPAPTPGG